MTDNKLEIESFNKIVAEAEKALMDAIERYKEDGYINDSEHSTDKDIRLTKALLVNPLSKEVYVTRVDIAPNEEFNFNYYIDAREYLDNPYEKTPAYLTSTKFVRTKLGSKELTNAENEQIVKSDAYQRIIAANQPGSNE